VRKNALVKLWKWEPDNLPSVIHSIRTAIAATISLAVARLFGLPEAYWAAIATLVVMQSTLGATLLISVERIAATALGALGGALLANYFTGNLLVFAAAVFVLGLFVRRISYGEERVPLRQHHARHHCAHPPFKRRLDRCAPPLLRSVGWNRRRPRAGRCLAGAPTQARKRNQRINCPFR